MLEHRKAALTRRRVGVASALFVLTLGVTAAANRSSPGARQAVESRAYYVTTEDGTRIAVDVTLPSARAASDRHPALLELTRYGRSREHPTTGEPLPSLGPLDRHFLDNGYAVVKVDARGSGASFGSRQVEYGPQEVRDGYDVVEWVVSQAWSDGHVGAYGTSYSGTTAEMLAAVNHPAVKAVIPGWSDFDTYASPVRPYGLLASSFMRIWGSLVGWMDENNVERLGASIRRIDEDEDGSLLEAALAEHQANPDVFESVLTSEYRDDDVGGGHTWDELAPIYWEDEIERSGVPMLVLVSWMDAGTADGALLRFRHFSNPQKLVIMASSHGGRANASPFSVSDEPLPPVPSVEEQFRLRREFFDHHLKGVANGVENWPAVRYFNLGEEAFRESQTWPPTGTSSEAPLYLSASGRLAMAPGANARDTYEVNAQVSTGTNNRWMTQMGEPVLNLDDRGAMDDRMLTYTTAPFDQALDVAGRPVLKLRLSSDRPDGALLVYLEDVAPDGRSRYLTEGGLRLTHRALSDPPQFEGETPYHSFKRADAAPLVPGAPMDIELRLWPIAFRIQPGHSLRLAIAGADADTFDPVVDSEGATFTVFHGLDQPSQLLLPVVTDP